MNIQRLRNLTTNRLHTEMSHVCQDIEYLTGAHGLMLPNARDALEPYLRKHVTDDRFWENRYDPEHQGEIDVPQMNNEEKSEFIMRYQNLTHPFRAHI